MRKIKFENESGVFISDKEFEKLNLTEKPEYSWPQVGDEYWYIDSGGSACTAGKLLWASSDRYRIESGNCYRTKKDAEMGKLRDEAFRVKNTAENGGDYWSWNFKKGKVTQFIEWSWDMYTTLPKFATKEEAQAWGDKYAKAIMHFNK